MAYVDLNPVRAGLAEHVEEIRDTSIFDRLQENSAEALADYLRPVMAGIDGRSTDADPAPGGGRCGRIAQPRKHGDARAWGHRG